MHERHHVLFRGVRKRQMLQRLGSLLQIRQRVSLEGLRKREVLLTAERGIHVATVAGRRSSRLRTPQRTLGVARRRKCVGWQGKTSFASW